MTAGSATRVVTGVERLEPDEERLLFAVGVFDGLHRGHRYLLARLRAHARRLGARPAVITFDAHPDAVIVGHAPPLLVDPDERLARLAQAGVAVAVVQHFDDALRRTPYDAFVRAIAEGTHLAGFVMTPDAAFGHERRGTPEALGELGRTMGFEVVVLPPYQLDGGPVRSQRIREVIAAGDLAQAARLLGRRHGVVGMRAATGGAEAATDDLRSAMPMALPPDGTYEVHQGSAWQPGWHGRPTRVEVAGGRIVLPQDGSAAPGRVVRVAFDQGVDDTA